MNKIFLFLFLLLPDDCKYQYTPRDSPNVYVHYEVQERHSLHVTYVRWYIYIKQPESSYNTSSGTHLHIFIHIPFSRYENNLHWAASYCRALTHISRKESGCSARRTRHWMVYSRNSEMPKDAGVLGIYS